MVKNRSIYILPNLFTSANIAAGFYSILEAQKGNFLIAAWVIMLAVLFDNLDGKIARLTHTESSFGVEYDSLSDLISFGVAPAFLLYVFVLHDFTRLGVIASFLFLLTGALRLARFNVQTSHNSNFIGLPIPGGAAAAASLIIVFLKFKIDYNSFALLFLIATFFIAFLMISPLKYRSFKKISTTKGISIRTFALIIFVLSLVIFKPYIFIPLVSFLYALSGIIEVAYKFLFKKKRCSNRGVNYE